MTKVKAAILGPGNIGTDLMYKLLKRSNLIEVALMAGVPESQGLGRAVEAGVPVSTGGVDAILERQDIDLVFDATSAYIHRQNAPKLKAAGKIAIDLTPAAIGPYVVPAVNMGDHLTTDNMNLVTCGGQATIPIVAAVGRLANVHYAEIVASIASKSAGPGTRQNIDEFTWTTARALERIGGAAEGKAIIVLRTGGRCKTVRIVEAGDHTILSGQLERLHPGDPGRQRARQRLPWISQAGWSHCRERLGGVRTNARNQDRLRQRRYR